MKNRITAFIVCCLLVVSSAVFAQIPRTISYQGVLSDTAGNPKPDATYSITFRLYQASSGGSAMWTETKNLTTKRGLFTTQLGDVTPFGPVGTFESNVNDSKSVANHAVNETNALAALAFDRQYWMSIQVGSDPELSPRTPLSSVPYSFSAIKADTAQYSLGGAGASQWTTNGSNIYYNTGNVGIGTETTPGALLHLEKSSNAGVELLRLTNPNIGANAYEFMRLGKDDISKWGVLCFTNLSQALSLFNNGGGPIELTTVGSASIKFSTNLTSVRMIVSGENGNVGIGTSTPTDSMTSAITATVGSSSNTTFFKTAGTFNGMRYGVVGSAIADTDVLSPRAGGYFYTGGNPPFAYAYVGARANDGTLYKITGSGLVATVMDTREGKKNLFAPESPEPWFEDFGNGQLSGGKCRIDLDPLFFDCVTVNDEHPMNVFIQLNDDCNGVFVRTDNSGFDVKELKGGTSDAKFTYRVVAKWKGYEKKRFPDASLPPTSVQMTSGQ